MTLERVFSTVLGTNSEGEGDRRELGDFNPRQGW